MRTVNEYHYLRRPKTLQERRAAQEGWNRAKRAICHLPHTWSDIEVNRDDRSWKHKRRTKYRIVKAA
jgi:hypothetical protein